MTAPPLVDVLVDPLLLELRDCLCTELGRSPMGPVCRCYVTHSFNAPVDDGCDCGCEQLPDGVPTAGVGDGRVRLVSLEPDVNISGAFGPVPQVCAAGWHAVVELSTSRCVPVAEDDEPLPAATLTDTAMRLGGDRAAMLRVLGCCGALAERDIQIEFAQPRGPLGGCAGWSLQFRVALPGGPGGCA